MGRHVPPDARLMVDLCRSDSSGEAMLAGLRRLDAPETWRALMETSRAHRVHALVLHALERLRKLPPEGLAELKLLRRQAMGWELEQHRVLARLEKHGLRPVVLKGGALRYQAYPEPALRPVADLDLLLPREAIAAARAALEDLGYRDQYDPEQTAKYERFHYHFILRHPGGFVVELHWGLTWPRPGVHLDAAEVFEAASPVAAARRPFLAPRPEHMVVHMAAQCAEDCFGRFGRIADIDRVIRAAGAGFDWDTLQEVARRGQLHVLLGVALRLAQLLLATPVPPGFIDRLGIGAFTRLNLAILRPVSWLLTQRGLAVASAGTVMGYWLEAAPAARRDLLLKLVGAREEPMEFPDAVDHTAPHPRWSGWLPAAAKAAGYQAAEWVGGLAAGVGLASRGEPRFWPGRGA